jgi:hypothetical protein
MGESTHRCPVGDCPAQVPRQQLMCPRHWRLMPGSLKRALYRAWQDGAGVGSREHQQAIRACIDAVSPPAPDEQLPDRVRRFLAAYRHPNAINGETWDEEDVSRAIRAIRCYPHQPDPRTRRCRRCGATVSVMAGTARRAKRPSPSVQMVAVSGRVVNLADPDPVTISVQDVAYALSMQCRFAGNVSRFWSVADHALLCSDLIREAGRAELALAALHHDSHEAFTGDVIAPVKLLLGGGIARVQRRLDQAIAAVVGIDPALFADPIVREVDRAAVHLEAHALRYGRGQLLSPPPVLRFATRALNGDEPEIAKERFLAADRRHAAF